SLSGPYCGALQEPKSCAKSRRFSKIPAARAQDYSRGGRQPRPRPGTSLTSESPEPSPRKPEARNDRRPHNLSPAPWTFTSGFRSWLDGYYAKGHPLPYRPWANSTLAQKG